MMMVLMDGANIRYGMMMVLMVIEDEYTVWYDDGTNMMMVLMVLKTNIRYGMMMVLI